MQSFLCKPLLAFLLAMATLEAVAQGFEGTILYSIKLDMSDPKAKAQMEEAQKKMADPATQAQMKEFQEKMKTDPQFKEMLESNPQMKAQMEKMLAKMQSGDVNTLIPSGIVIKVKNNNSISKMEGGVIDSEFLYLKDKDQSYMIDRDSKTYSLVDKYSENDEKDRKVTKTKETTKVMGYTCTKYIVEVSYDDKKYEHHIWATTEIKDLDTRSFGNSGIDKKGSSFYFKDIEGVPLKMEMKSPEGTFIMEVTQLKRESLPAALFSLPSDYKQVALH